VPAGPSLPPLASEPVLVAVGDISCTAHWVVTPNGSFPLAGTTWIVINQTITTERIPAWAIVMCILLVLACLLGLLFLLVKERRTQGFAAVTVQGPVGYHVAQVPISHPSQVAEVEAKVNYIRAVAAGARG